MAAQMGEIEVGVTPVLSPEGQKLVEQALEAFGGAFDAIVRSKAQALLDVSNALRSAHEPAAEEPPSEPQIIEWPLKTRPPRLIAKCPGCGQHVDVEAETFEIVLDPTSTSDATTVRGRLRHDHEDGSMSAWPYVATYTPPPARYVHDPVIGDISPEVEDVEQGQASPLDVPFEFVPDSDGSLSLRNAVMQALGAASVCWDAVDQAGTFDPDRAIEVGEALMQRIESERPAGVNDESVRQIMSTWDDVVKHPYIARAFEVGPTLHDGIIAVLDEAQRAEAERVRLQQIIYRARTRLREIISTRHTAGSPEDIADILAAVDNVESRRARRGDR